MEQKTVQAVWVLPLATYMGILDGGGLSGHVSFSFQNPNVPWVYMGEMERRRETHCRGTCWRKHKG